MQGWIERKMTKVVALMGRLIVSDRLEYFDYGMCAQVFMDKRTISFRFFETWKERFLSSSVEQNNLYLLFNVPSSFDLILNLYNKNFVHKGSKGECVWISFIKSN